MSACVVWGGTLHEGYPVLGSRRAHRDAYEAAHGPIPVGHVVHHTCDVKACVNPEHLEVMTPRAHMLLHRSWERSHEKLRAQNTCKYGHPRDRWRTVHGVRRRYCRTCNLIDQRRRAAIRRLEPQLPKTAAFAQALAVDETPAEPFKEELPPIEGES
jgi:hypothetical protein